MSDSNGSADRPMRAEGTSKVTGVDGGTVVLQKGEWFIQPKARTARMMLNHLSKEARRVYAYLDLHTMGFQRETAVTIDQRTGRERLATTTDIARESGLDDGHVRRAFMELDDEGLAERCGTADGPLHKGKVEIHSWSTPRAPRKVKRGPRAAGIKGETPAWVPESWQALTRFAKRHRLEIPEILRGDLAAEIQAARGPLFEEAEKIARGLKEAEEQAARFWETVHAQSAYKEERNRKELEKTTTTGAPQPAGDVVVVSQRLAVKLPVAEKFIANCRAQDPVSTTDDIIAAINEVDRTINRRVVKNPTAILLETVPVKIAAMAAGRRQMAQEVQSAARHKSIPYELPGHNMRLEKCPACGFEAVTDGVCRSKPCLEAARKRGKAKGAAGDD